MQKTKKLPVTLQQRLIKVNSVPETGFKPVIVLEEREFEKLVDSLEFMKEPWIAMKLGDTIFVAWQNLIFLHVLCNDSMSAEKEKR